MKIWPRGKYNGQKIVGFSVKMRVNVLWWDLKISWTSYLKFIHIGPVMFNFEGMYE